MANKIMEVVMRIPVSAEKIQIVVGNILSEPAYENLDRRYYRVLEIAGDRIILREIPVENIFLPFSTIKRLPDAGKKYNRRVYEFSDLVDQPGYYQSTVIKNSLVSINEK